jgi:hypothetical protein
MKKVMLMLLMVLCFSFTAQAATVTWDHDGVNTLGYTVCWHKTTEPGMVKTRDVPGNTARSLIISDTEFEPNVEYTFYGFAYNSWAQSVKSNTATWTRVVSEYQPPLDTDPDDYPTSPPSEMKLKSFTVTKTWVPKQ